MKILSTMAAAAVAFIALGGVASAETINCPTNQTTKTIVTPLPSGWWTTPYVNNLTDTRIEPIGGHPALICVYGPNGTVQRNAPDGRDCTAHPGGFECTPRIVFHPPPGGFHPGPGWPGPGGGGGYHPGGGNPGTYSTGALDVPQTFTFDLDHGVVGGGPGVDMWFEADTMTLLYLVPRNGATMWTGDRSNRNYEGCAAGGHYTPDRISLSDLPVGSYVCVKTNEGRISQYRVNGITGGGGPKTLHLGYTTWNN